MRPDPNRSEGFEEMTPLERYMQAREIVAEGYRAMKNNNSYYMAKNFIAGYESRSPEIKELVEGIQKALQELGGPKMDYEPGIALGEYKTASKITAGILLKALTAHQGKEKSK